MSPMACRTTFLSALSACEAAPVPRPPQPTSPTFKVSLLAAKSLGATEMYGAIAAPAASMEDCFKKPLRCVPRRDSGEEFMTRNRFATRPDSSRLQPHRPGGD